MRYKRPEDYKIKDQKTPLSCRVKVESKDLLEKRARKAGMSLGELVAQIIEDYVDWLDKETSK